MKVLVALHVLGAVLFVGNIITAAFWKLLAERDGNVQGIVATVQRVMLADYFFTIPGGILLLATGHILVEMSGNVYWKMGWFNLAYGAFGVSGLLWAFVLLPAQRRMIKFSEASLGIGKLSDEYRRASNTWNLWGTVSTLLPMVTLYLMVAKPFL